MSKNENHIFEYRKGGKAYEVRRKVYRDPGDGKEKVDPHYIPSLSEIKERAAGGKKTAEKIEKTGRFTAGCREFCLGAFDRAGHKHVTKRPTFIF